MNRPTLSLMRLLCLCLTPAATGLLCNFLLLIECRRKWQFRFGMAEWWLGADQEGTGKQFWGQFDPVSPGGRGYNQYPTPAAAECC